MEIYHKLFKYYQEKIQLKFPHASAYAVEAAAQESALKEVERYDEEEDFNRTWELFLQSAGSSIRDTLKSVS